MVKITTLQIVAIDKPIKNLTIKDSDHDSILKTVEIINPDENLVAVEANIGAVSNLYIYASAERDGKVFIPLTTIINNTCNYYSMLLAF